MMLGEKEGGWFISYEQYGGKCYVPNCKSGYHSQVKDTKTTCDKLREEWEDKIDRGGK